MVLHRSLELDSLDGLFLHLQLRNLDRCRKLRIFYRTFPAYVQVHAAGNLHVACLDRLQFLQAEILRLDVRIVSLGFREIIHVGPGCACGHLHRQICFDCVPIALKLYAQVLD